MNRLIKFDMQEEFVKLKNLVSSIQNLLKDTCNKKLIRSKGRQSRRDFKGACMLCIKIGRDLTLYFVRVSGLYTYITVLS